VDGCEARIAELETERATLLRHLGKNNISEKDFHTANVQIDLELGGIKKFVRKQREEIATKDHLTTKNHPVDVETLRKRYGFALDNLEFKDRQELIQLVVDKILVRGKKEFEIKFKRPAISDGSKVDHTSLNCS